MQPTFAFFDFDGTLTKRDSYLDFIRYVRGRLGYLSGLLRLSPWIFLYGIGLYRNDRLKERFFRHFLSAFSPADLDQRGQQYSQHRLPAILKKTALDQLHWHQHQGHRVVILTASSPIWLSDWCKAHQVELIGTEFEIIDGRYTGQIKGKNCHGREKARIVKNILSKYYNPISYGYGDSRADRFFLGQVTFRGGR
jgi:phosphatidylglycerophosphatase C